MASSTLSSEIGWPFRMGSCFGFLSFAGVAGLGTAASAHGARSSATASNEARKERRFGAPGCEASRKGLMAIWRRETKLYPALFTDRITRGRKNYSRSKSTERD